MAIIRWRIPSTTDMDLMYTITVDTFLGTVSCTCKGFQTRGRCKHIKFYRKLIKKMLAGK